MPAFSENYYRNRGTGARAAVDPMQQLLAPTQTVINDLNSNNYAGAWQTALSTSPLFGTNYNAQTTDPLLQALESSQGLHALDPTKVWNPQQTAAYYNAFNANPVYHGQTTQGMGGAESLGKNPYGLWGSASAIPSDIQANLSQEGVTPDVQRFVGAHPSQSFLSKYGSDIAMLAAAVIAPEVVPELAGALGGSSVAAGALYGAGTTAAIDAAGGKPITWGGIAGGALGGAAGAGLTGMGGNLISGYTGLPSGIASGLAGAGIGATRSALTGGNVGIGALGGGIGGAIQGSGVGAAARGALTDAGVPNSVAGGLVGAGTGALVGGVAGAITGSVNNSGVQGNGMANNGISPLMSGAGGYSGNAVGNAGSVNSTGTSPYDFSSIGSTLGSLLGPAASIYGAQNASQSQVGGINAGINQQNVTMGNISNLLGPQQTLGNQAFGALGSTLGINGQPANYSNFYNMPGYQFAVNQGTQAIDRMASAGGSLYTPNTAINVGQYVTGTAAQDYNTYVGQLMGAAGLGANANQQLTGANLQTGGNISQLYQNKGNAQASGVAGTAGIISTLLNQGGLGRAIGGGIGGLFNGNPYVNGSGGPLTGAAGAGQYASSAPPTFDQSAVTPPDWLENDQPVYDTGGYS